MKDFKVNGCTELTEDDLDKVSGGGWKFYDSDNNGTTDKVDVSSCGAFLGTFNCNGQSADKIDGIIGQHPTWSARQVLDEALRLGYVW